MEININKMVINLYKIKSQFNYFLDKYNNL